MRKYKRKYTSIAATRTTYVLLILMRLGVISKDSYIVFNTYEYVVRMLTRGIKL